MTDALVLVRHGETVWNTERRFQGRADSPLTEVGRAQARRHAQTLERLPPEVVVASPLPRAAETARLIAEALGRALTFDDALVERSMGAFEGWTAEELRERAPEAWSRRQADPWSFRPPGGESYPDLQARVAPVARRLRCRREGVVAVVSHGTLVRVLLAELLGLCPAQALRVRQPNDVVYHVCLGAGAPRVCHERDGHAVPGLLLAPR